MPDELAFLTIADAARLIAQRQLSPVELTTALIRRTEALDPQLNAYLLLTADRALDRAREAEREIMARHYRGPMHGTEGHLCDSGDPHDRPFADLSQHGPLRRRDDRAQAVRVGSRPDRQARDP
jgi:Amidase